ncbi:adenylate/guanylate cyclase domain-containing protein [Planktothrix sp. FACHB-1355]|uniref:Adenylate/guanylate cyclase domain-containing protein n=1 Tax=Aerosakkonema funiforme FACHB-1375 TaxID=2949571 RepID=A0A926VH76_9CYAN|nr:FHA domain-containing protein [Aerosakkonema funiforme]MBD2183645.1 adenylate/guanylate cyclase domain-containing protein [Aerosakkonema funiforme FACHB-1375]MBD3562696.1 adenylate/guanylate cyclase domain-containing protein [Planktothrix sp. FACHB-1355]
MVTLQPTTTPYLLLRTDSGNRYLPLVGSHCWTIGRSDDNNFVIPDRWISRNHAMLQSMETGEFYLIDLGSRNGSFVNGRRVSVPVTLKHGDNLTFGQTELEFFSPTVSYQANSSTSSHSDELTATSTLHVRRLISVMVVDIRDFTVLTRQLDEKILSELIGTWFRHSGSIIREHGSWVDKYIGDAIMAVWFHGSRGISDQEMTGICNALSDLHKMTEELHAQYSLPFPLRIGAGINTGYAMVGNTGSGDRPDYTALGDTVNAAFRLESSTKELRLDVALGETTYKYLLPLGIDQSGFKQYTVHLKGYDKPTLTYAGTFANLDTLLQTQPQNQ